MVKEAKAKGFADVLFLDAVEHKFVEEVSSCNVFIVKVMLHGSILLLCHVYHFPLPRVLIGHFFSVSNTRYIHTSISSG